MNLTAARQLATEARSAVDGDVLVTLRADEVAPALNAGQRAVLISPPTTSWPTNYQAEARWLIHLIAGPRNDIETAWDALDALTRDLTTIWGTPDEAAPAEWIDAAGQPWPAFTLTVTTHHDLDQ